MRDSAPCVIGDVRDKPGDACTLEESAAAVSAQLTLGALHQGAACTPSISDAAHHCHRNFLGVSSPAPPGIHDSS
jgi:hypothetical protein